MKESVALGKEKALLKNANKSSGRIYSMVPERTLNVVKLSWLFMASVLQEYAGIEKTMNYTLEYFHKACRGMLLWVNICRLGGSEKPEPCREWVSDTPLELTSSALWWNDWLIEAFIPSSVGGKWMLLLQPMANRWSAALLPKGVRGLAMSWHRNVKFPTAT